MSLIERMRAKQQHVTTPTNTGRPPLKSQGGDEHTDWRHCVEMIRQAQLSAIHSQR